MEEIAYKCILHSKGTLAPIEIVRNIKLIGRQFRARREEDCHEFMRCLIDGMQMSSIGFNVKLARPLQETSIIYRIFMGKLRSQITCLSCNRISAITEAFLDISLELKNSNNISQCLHNFCREERLTQNNRYSCSQCKKLTEACKQFSIDTRIIFYLSN
jgi:ubiquitin carboxyl-terminal hydrolase 36/42